MDRYFYDMHLHSCLSPCGDNDMTPNNLVNMAALNELDFIALTDHNSCKNCPAAAAVANEVNICFICGMELCTVEEIHIICLFPSLEKAMDFDCFVEKHIPDIANDEKAFGEQLILDKNDCETARFDKLLVTATDISVSDIFKIVAGFDGVCYPAHIDKSSYSIISSLGTFPDDCGFTAAEITAKGDVALLRNQYDLLQNIPLILSSDAHYLEDINPRRAWLELDKLSPKAVIDALLSGKCSFGRG